MASVNFQLALVAASHGAASCWRIQSAGGVLSADTAGLDRSRRGGASETLLSSHSTLCLSGLGPVPDCVTATVGGSQCWLLAVVYCGGYFDFVVFTLAVTGSLVAEETHSQCSDCPASDYVSAPVVFYRKAVMAGTHSEFVAVPWVSLVTVPSTLLGCLLLPILEQAAGTIWQLSDWSVQLLWKFLYLLPRDLGFLVSPVGASSLVLAAALLAGLCLMLPRHLCERWLGVLPLTLLLLFSDKPKFGLRVTVLDVGQGLAVVVETKGHSLLYDSAAQYSPVQLLVPAAALLRPIYVRGAGAPLI